MASALFEIERAKNEAVATWTVHLHFDAFDDLPAKDFYWATGEGIELEDGNIYEQFLTDIPKGRHQRGRGNDYAEFSVVNTDYALYAELLPYHDIIEKGEVEIRKCYEVSKDFWESESMFTGYCKDFTLDDGDNDIKFTAISDMSRTGFPVGNRILTRERCGTELNVNGLLSPEESICGWQTAQGGNPIYCSKYLKGVDGCLAHNNSHRFYAVKGLNTADVTITTGGGTGWDHNSGPCFDENAYMLMADWSLVPLHKTKIHDKHMGFDLFDNDKLIAGEILNEKVTEVDEICYAKFDMASFGVRKDHLFYIGSQTYAPVAVLGDRPAIGIDLARKPSKSHLLSIETSIERLFVYSRHTSTNNYIVTDKDARFFYFVHNQKPIYTIVT